MKHTQQVLEQITEFHKCEFNTLHVTNEYYAKMGSSDAQHFMRNVASSSPCWFVVFMPMNVRYVITLSKALDWRFNEPGQSRICISMGIPF